MLWCFCAWVSRGQYDAHVLCCRPTGKQGSQEAQPAARGADPSPGRGTQPPSISHCRVRLEPSPFSSTLVLRIPSLPLFWARHTLFGVRDTTCKGLQKTAETPSESLQQEAFRCGLSRAPTSFPPLPFSYQNCLWDIESGRNDTGVTLLLKMSKTICRDRGGSWPRQNKGTQFTTCQGPSGAGGL